MGLFMSRTHHILLRIVSQKRKIDRRELIETVGKFGKSADSVRASIRRMVAAGLLNEEGAGRGRVTYTLGPRGGGHTDELITKTIRWFRFLGGFDPWDGRWTMAVFSIPETLRKQRDLLRGGLVQRGFGQLSPGAWVAPFDRRADVDALSASLSVSGMVSVLVTDDVSVFGVREPRVIAGTVWPLAALQKRYHEFNRRAGGLIRDIEAKKANERERLFFRGIDLQDEFMEIILDDDPCLPRELLPPDDWPGLPAHDLFHRLVRALSQMEPMCTTYGYFFHLVDGMEQAAEYHREGEFDFHRPDE